MRIPLRYVVDSPKKQAQVDSLTKDIDMAGEKGWIVDVPGWEEERQEGNSKSKRKSARVTSERKRKKSKSKRKSARVASERKRKKSKRKTARARARATSARNLSKRLFTQYSCSILKTVSSILYTHNIIFYSVSASIHTAS